MIFNILDGYEKNVFADTRNLFMYCDKFLEDSGILKYDVDEAKFISVLQVMRENFPHIDGLDKSNPFKKVATFVVNFIAERPFSEPFPDSFIIDGKQLNTIKNHQNAFMAYNIAVDSLVNAKIYQHGSETPLILENEIKISKHSLVDIIEALSTATPSTHFQIVSVLFEQLSYRANPDASYPLVY